MQRKLVQQGSSTLMVSLPSRWVKENELTKGSTIELTESKDHIQISTSQTKKKKTAIVNLEESNIIGNRILLALYKEGYDKVEINLPQPIIAEIEKTTGQLIGFEIIKQEKNSCTVKDITGVEDANINIIIRRLFLLTKSMGQDCLTAIKNNNKETLKLMDHRDTDINKFSYYAQRILTKQGHPEKEKIIPMYAIVDSLEEIGDEYKKICRKILKNKLKLTSKEINLFSEVNEFLNLCYKFIYTLKEKEASDIGKIYAKFRELFTKEKIINHHVAHHLENISKKCIKIERAFLPFISNIVKD